MTKNNPKDSTLRNVQAANKKIAKLRDEVKALKLEHKVLKARLKEIYQRLDQNGVY